MKLRKPYDDPHRRFNPLNGSWVLVSPHRTERPWLGQIETKAEPSNLAYDPDCYLCPGNLRSGGIRNPSYDTTFVFTNDFAALKPDLEAARQDESGRGLLLSESESGTCRVVCYSPYHNKTLARMTVPEIVSVINVWVEHYAELGLQPKVSYVQVFENRGEMMGCSNPHPHGQIWANRTLPDEPRREQDAQQAYLNKWSACMLCDYLRLERNAQSRVVLENAHFVALVPFWATWPFEVLILSKHHARDLLSFDGAARSSLAEILKGITTRYDNLFETPFPYSMGFHQSPTDGESHPEWHFHAHFYPPLLRSATVRKFMVGYEMLAGPQRDIAPEDAAASLRTFSGIHYADHKRS